MTEPSVSVIVCTCNRADSLRSTLDSLRRLTYPNLEVVVVEGPSTDHTPAVLGDFDGMVKRVRTGERNLSLSRNLGIAAAAGEIVAFVDDDATPDGTWLDDLIGVFSDPEVSATGGPVLDYTGCQLQARYNLANRWGDSHVELEPKRLEVLDHPDTWEFPYPMGTNALFRRELLVALGGFDENFAFYLDETDVCLRMIDAGYRMVPQERGLVHHKYLASGIRNAERVTVDRYLILLSRAYFSLRHGLPRADELDMITSYNHFVELHRADLLAHTAAGRAAPEAVPQFDRDAAAAWKAAKDLVAEHAHTRPAEWFDAATKPFLPFPTLRPAGRALRLCVVSQDYPPGAVPGIGRASYTLATGLAAAGHLVHVITESRTGHSTVDLEDGVWVHRLVSAPRGTPPIEHLPQPRWDRAVSVLEEIQRLGEFVWIDEVFVPNWDAEGLAVILDRRFRTCLYAYTPVLAVGEVDTRLDPAHPAVAALATAERMSYEMADLVMVSFPETLRELERLYAVRIPDARAAIVPLGLPDVAAQSSPERGDHVEIVFVGRLEPRKGADTLLRVIPGLCARYPNVRFTLIGDDTITPAAGEPSYRHQFERTVLPEILERVTFTGPVPDDELNAALARCDIFVAPSRFESFGLMNLEAMRVGKPVVSTTVNGIKSVLRDGEDGALVPPGDPGALAAALGRLIEDPAERARLGHNGRASFESKFTVERMVERMIESFEALLDGSPQPHQPAPKQSASPEDPDQMIEAMAERQRRLLDALRCPQCRRRLDVDAEVTTLDGRVKTGTLLCQACDRAVAAIQSFQITFAEVSPVPPQSRRSPRTVATLGEQHVTATDSAALVAGWDTHPDCWVGTKGGATITLKVPCSDVRVRLVHHPAGGVFDVSIDGTLAATIDTCSGPGSVSGIVDVATDLPVAPHEIVLTVRDAAPGSYVLIHELLLLGPMADGLPFTPARPFARANPQSERILRHIRACDPSGLILEAGGGDRRTDRANYINLEYLPYEGADLRADIHRLPFDDDTFDLVVNQAVLEHLSDPVIATEEMVRVCKPGGLILSEVAFMQPLHGVPFHFFNMTGWGVEHLFETTCTIEESDWFGELSFTMSWMLDVAGVTAKLPPEERDAWTRRLASLDELIDHDALKPVASGVWVAARKRSE